MTFVALYTCSPTVSSIENDIIYEESEMVGGKWLEKSGCNKTSMENVGETG